MDSGSASTVSEPARLLPTLLDESDQGSDAGGERCNERQGTQAVQVRGGHGVSGRHSGNDARLRFQVARQRKLRRGDNQGHFYTPLTASFETTPTIKGHARSLFIHAEHVVHRRGYCFHFGCMYVCMYVSAR